MRLSDNWYGKTIVALDFESPERAYEVVDTLADEVQWYKVGPTLFTQSGPEVIQYLHKKKKQIFLDLKLHDTPKAVAQTVAQFAEMGVQFATVHCLGGKKMLDAASQGCRGTALKLLGVTLLTSEVASSYEPFGWKGSDGEFVKELVGLAESARLSGILCSATELSLINPIRNADFLAIAAGIRHPKLPVYQDDQLRTATAKEAMLQGADYVIVGRPITQSSNPKSALKQLFE